ncbi:MAG: hypothetical protein ACYC61_22855 [Isosphaeraceae bacterium]
MATETPAENTTLPLPPGSVLRPVGMPHPSPLPVAPGYGTRLVIDLPPDGARALNELLEQSGEDVTDLFQRALALYKLSKEAVQQGKFVGVADNAECLETQFVGL